jgi:ribonuclease P protein component
VGTSCHTFSWIELDKAGFRRPGRRRKASAILRQPPERTSFERDDEEDRDVQANLPTEQPPPSPQTRVPRTDADAGGPVDLGATAREGPDAAVRVGTSTSADRVARTLSSGQAFHGERVVVFVAPGAGSAAFVAGRRIGGAVLRNRARRILRAAWRELADEVEDGYDVVVVARAAIVGARTQELVAEVAELLSRAQVIRT